MYVRATPRGHNDRPDSGELLLVQPKKHADNGTNEHLLVYGGKTRAGFVSDFRHKNIKNKDEIHTFPRVK